MKVEVISIGTELLMSDVLDTNAAYVSRSLREIKVNLTCKVTVGDDAEMITDAVRVGLRRADVVLSLGGMGGGVHDLTRQAVATAVGRNAHTLLQEAVMLGGSEAPSSGLMLREGNSTIICLPGRRHEMAYLLETDVLPYLRKRINEEAESPIQSGWILLRTVGVMESSLRYQLADLPLDHNARLTFDSFAGRTNLRLWVEAETEEAVQVQLRRMREAVVARLGDHVYGEERDRLEDVVMKLLLQSDVSLAVVECCTDHVFARMLGQIEGAEKAVTVLPQATLEKVSAALDVAADQDLTGWSREAAERLLVQQGVDLALVVYNNVTQGGIQVLVTLASSHGVSVTQRSFGGHPENIDQWAFTLGLAHLRRWLLVHS